MADLITQLYLTSALADYNLTANQVGQLPNKAAEASRLVRDWCNRQFTRATYDQLFTADVRKPVLLREYPVNAVLQASGNPTAVLTVTQSDAATNQRALVGLSATGSADAGLVTTGLTLTRVASGVKTATPLLFASYPTLAGLAAAIAGLGQGWTATVATGYGPWATADLRAVQGNLPAMTPGGADFLIHVDDLPFSLDEETWAVTIGSASSDDPWQSSRWGPGAFETSFGDQRLRPARNNLRVVYDAGFDAIPGPVQQACVEIVKAMFERLKTDSTLKSESDGAYSWTARDAIAAIPPEVAGALALYRCTRA